MKPPKKGGGPPTKGGGPPTKKLGPADLEKLPKLKLPPGSEQKAVMDELEKAFPGSTNKPRPPGPRGPLTTRPTARPSAAQPEDFDEYVQRLVREWGGDPQDFDDIVEPSVKRAKQAIPRAAGRRVRQEFSKETAKQARRIAEKQARRVAQRAALKQGGKAALKGAAKGLSWAAAPITEIAFPTYASAGEPAALREAEAARGAIPRHDPAMVPIERLQQIPPDRLQMYLQLDEAGISAEDLSMFSLGAAPPELSTMFEALGIGPDDALNYLELQQGLDDPIVGPMFLQMLEQQQNAGSLDELAVMMGG